VGVLTNLLEIQMQQTPHPNDMTNDDRNLYLAILDAAKKCTHVTFQYLHVKGHQDKDPKRVLTTAEQHNVDCDCYAKQHILKQVIHSTTYGNPAFAVAAPHLKIDGKIICHKFLPALRDAAAIPPYWDYLKKTQLEPCRYLEYSMVCSKPCHAIPAMQGPTTNYTVYPQQATSTVIQVSPTPWLKAMPIMPMSDGRCKAFLRVQQQ